MHTNVDKVMDGVSGAMAQALGLENIDILAPEPCPMPDTPQTVACGLGIVGDLPKKMSTPSFFNHLKKVFHLKHFKASEVFIPEVSRVALCGGSGTSLIPFALESGAQVFVSADFSYHTYFETIPRLMLVDIGHYESEAGIQEVICNELKKKIPTFDVRKTRICTNPIQIY
jgi:putative NIF3 family GTP cyclohydrolase 1 type 2